MPDNGAEDPQEVDRPQDPIVERRRPDPSQPPESLLTMSGFLGDSERPGYRRLYFTRDLDYFAEFRSDDVVTMSSIARDEEPFRGEEATRVSLRRDAMVDYTRTRVARPIDEFDLDVRFARLSRRLPRFPFLTDSCEHGCPEPGTVGGRPCVTYQTCAETCETCLTNCGSCETCVDWPTC